MMFSWERFCEDYRFEVRDSGASTAKNNIYIHCPWCGPADRKGMMGLSLITTKWGCWKNESHRGTRPHRLIRVLLNCTYEEADKIVGDPDAVPRESLDELRARLNADEPGRHLLLKPVEWLPEFFKIQNSEDALGADKRFPEYLAKRGFHDIDALRDCYDLRAATIGPHRWRVAFPFYLDGHLYGWSSRAISSDARLRYLTYPEGNIASHLVFNADNALRGGHLLVVVEGPFDALKVDFYGREEGIRSVALLGLGLTKSKINLISRISKRFDRVAILLDQEMVARSMDMAEKMAFTDPLVLRLPDHAKDPGELQPEEVIALEKQVWYY